jgi:hypothetical protein
MLQDRALPFLGFPRQIDGLLSPMGQLFPQPPPRHQIMKYFPLSLLTFAATGCAHREFDITPAQLTQRTPTPKLNPTQPSPRSVQKIQQRRPPP